MVEKIEEIMAGVGSLELSVIICTRDRADMLLPAVQSVLADLPSDGSAELLVVDQGRDDSAAEALAPLLNDSRLRYLRENSVGLSKARNAGIRAARGGLIAFTDDDCTVEPGWASALTETFATYPDVGLICGDVEPAPHDPSQGSLLGFAAKEGMFTRWRSFSGDWAGIGANMALRRTTWQEIGPFDELLGSGAPFKAADDGDYFFRVLHHRIGIYQSARARVIHYGFRPKTHARDLFVGYALGSGFMHGKHVRSGNFFAAALWLSGLLRAMWIVASNLIRRRHPSGARAMTSDLKGFWRGLWMPLGRSGTGSDRRISE